MNVYLAGSFSRKRLFDDGKAKPLYILESMYYVEQWQLEKMHEWKDFLLDSGAFTFMNGASPGQKIDWNAYIDRYAGLIREYDIKHFFELDIDSIVGYDEVKRLRSMLEKKTGKQCIPVWHKQRGIEEYHNLVNEYGYISIGGIVIKDIKRTQYPVFTELLRIAHEKGCKVHGLGFTNTTLLHKYHFDSVDSSSWLSASRFKQIQYFDGKKMSQYTCDKKMKHYTVVDDFVFNEWIKFQRFAENFCKGRKHQ